MSSTRLRRFLPTLAIAVVSVAVYLPGLPGEFVYDDHRLIADNDGLKRPFDWRRSVLRDYYASDIDRIGLGYYRPVALLSNELDYRRSGGSPAAFHATNIAIHAACTMLVAALAAGLLGVGPAAWSAALLFAVTPVHAETVAFISGRVDSLAALFGLLALLCHLAANASKTPAVWRVGAGAAWLLSLGSKEMAITVPVVALLVETSEEGWPGGRRMLERLPRYLPYVLAWIVYLPLRMAALGSLMPPSARGASLAIARPPVVVGSYVAWLIAPPPGLHLEPDLAGGALAVAASVLAGSVIVGVAVLWRRGLRIEGALLGACVVTLLPVAQLKPLETTLSERFLYFPSAMAAVLAGAVVRRAGTGRRLAIAGATVLLASAAYASILVPRARLWRDEVALWEAKDRESGGSLKARLNLARAYAHRGERERAVRAYDAATRLAPELAEGLSAEIAAVTSDVGSADYEKSLSKSLAELPNDATLWNNLGFHRYRTGDLAGAQDAFARATELTPARSTAWLGLALTHLAAGELAEADAAAVRARAISPDLGEAAAIRVECALKLGRPCDAVALAAGIELSEPGERAVLERMVARARALCGR